MASYESCPFCEASFQLVNGKFPRHLDVRRSGTCPGADKTLADAEAAERNMSLFGARTVCPYCTTKMSVGHESRLPEHRVVNGVCDGSERKVVSMDSVGRAVLMAGDGRDTCHICGTRANVSGGVLMRHVNPDTRTVCSGTGKTPDETRKHYSVSMDGLDSSVRCQNCGCKGTDHRGSDGKCPATSSHGQPAPFPSLAGDDKKVDKALAKYWSSSTSYKPQR